MTWLRLLASQILASILGPSVDQSLLYPRTTFIASRHPCGVAAFWSSLSTRSSGPVAFYWTEECRTLAMDHCDASGYNCQVQSSDRHELPHHPAYTTESLCSWFTGCSTRHNMCSGAYLGDPVF